MLGESYPLNPGSFRYCGTKLACSTRATSTPEPLMPPVSAGVTTRTAIMERCYSRASGPSIGTRRRRTRAFETGQPMQRVGEDRGPRPKGGAEQLSMGHRGMRMLEGMPAIGQSGPRRWWRT
jgi:hypothetical protein